LTVDERGAGAHERDEMWCVDASPSLLRGVEEFVGVGCQNSITPLTREFAGACRSLGGQQTDFLIDVFGYYP
jgi:hypothetical protein